MRANRRRDTGPERRVRSLLPHARFAIPVYYLVATAEGSGAAADCGGGRAVQLQPALVPRAVARQHFLRGLG